MHASVWMYALACVRRVRAHAHAHAPVFACFRARARACPARVRALVLTRAGQDSEETRIRTRIPGGSARACFDARRTQAPLRAAALPPGRATRARVGSHGKTRKRRTGPVGGAGRPCAVAGASRGAGPAMRPARRRRGGEGRVGGACSMPARRGGKEWRRRETGRRCAEVVRLPTARRGLRPPRRSAGGGRH